MSECSDFDLTGTDEEYWARAQSRVEEKRRELAGKDPNDEAVWEELEKLRKLEEYIEVCRPKREPGGEEPL
jgi:hypothetical protein